MSSKNKTPNNLVPCVRMPFPCSMAPFFLDGERSESLFEFDDMFPEPIANLIWDYLGALQNLQLAILEEEPRNKTEIGLGFKELENNFQKIISGFKQDSDIDAKHKKS